MSPGGSGRNDSTAGDLGPPPSALLQERLTCKRPIQEVTGLDWHLRSKREK